jgi:hypothetical protein
MDNNSMQIECLKLNESGTVKRIIWDDKLSNILESSFFKDDIFTTASIVYNANYSFQIKLGNDDYIFYEYNHCDNDNLYYQIKYSNGFIENRMYKYYNSSNYSENNEKINIKREIEFICISCNNKFKIFPNEKYDAFVCKTCRSVYTYEWLADKLQIITIKKIKNIPLEIKKILEFFGCSENKINMDIIKTKYRELLTQYHPDKVLNLGNEIKEVAERKTREIINNYEKLNKWMKKNN